MRIQSAVFGDIDIDEKSIYEFPKGIPGLTGIQKYALVEVEGGEPYRWLQACEAPFLSLMVIDPHVVKEDYDIDLNDDQRKLLDLEGEEKPNALSIVVVPEDPSQMTANLLAPILLNPHKLRGAQAIVNGPQDWLRVKILEA